MKKKLIGGAAALAFSAAVGFAPAANAQIIQDGLVNVAVENTTVQIPIAIAANVCGVAVQVLAQAEDLGDVTCTAEGVSLAENEEGDSGPVQQQGLVNVALVNTEVQVPVTVAANICGVAVQVLATAEEVGDVQCTTDGVSIAEIS
jgi:hypothetical protein